jgi:hypothetical protein
MALEDIVAENTKAVKEHTAAVKELIAAVKSGSLSPAAAGAAATGAGKTTGKAAPAKPKHSADEVKGKMMELKESVDMTACKDAITGVGAKDLADLLNKPELYDKVYDAMQAKIDEASAGGSVEDDGLGGL